MARKRFRTGPIRADRAAAPIRGPTPTRVSARGGSLDDMSEAVTNDVAPQGAEVRWETHPVTPDRFEDFADVINPNRRATHCWCLSHRVNPKQVTELGGTGPDARERAMRALCEREHPPGVVTYRDGVPVGWCSIAPRAETPRLVQSKLIRPVDDVPVWSIICVVVRSGHRRQHVTEHLLEGAVAYAASRGAPAVEAYPVDTEGRRMDLTMAFVGTRAMFEKVGFRVIGATDAVASKMPRLVMRRDL